MSDIRAVEDADATGGASGGRIRRKSGRTPATLQVRRRIAFAGAAVISIWLALHGGSFDVVIRQQTALVLWWAIAVGFAVGALPRAQLDRSLLIPAAALAGLVVWTFLALSWTESDERTWAEFTRLLGYAAFVVLAWAGLNRYTFRAAAAGLSTGAAIVCAIALASRLMPASFPVDDVSVVFNTDRLNYPFGYWNAVAAWGAMTVAICLCWSAHARRPLSRALALGAVPVAGTAVYLTYSRGGVLSVIVALLATVALSRNRWTAGINALAAGAATGVVVLVVRANPAIADATGGGGGATVALVVVLAALACAALAVLTISIGIDRVRLDVNAARIAVPVTLVAVVVVGGVAGHRVIGDAWDEFLHDDVSTKSGAERLATAGGDRNDLWGSSIDAFQSKGFTGIGPGTFEFWWNRDGRVRSPVVNAHSLYFETLAESGAVGLVLLLALIGGLLYTGVRGRMVARRTNDLGANAAMLAGFVVFLFGAGLDWLWQFPALVVLGLGGVAIAAAGNSERIGRPAAGLARVRVAAYVLAFAIGAAQVPSLIATDRVRRAERALAAGDPATARDDADDAVSAEPWAATPRAQRAFAEEALGDLDAARADLEDARDREDTNWEWAADLAAIDRRLGDAKSARAAEAEAARLNRIGTQ